MAYAARIEANYAEPIVYHPASANENHAEADFSALEWSVIRHSRQDSLSTLRAPGRFSRFLQWLTGRHTSPELANPKLEALRRAAVLSWHYGFTVPGRDVADFLSAGFSLDQYELMVLRIGAAIRSPARRIFA